MDQDIKLYINPLSRMVLMDLRKKIIHEQSKITLHEGLEVDAEIDIVYRLQKEKAKEIFINVGPNYENVLLDPQIKSIIRDTISGYDAKALYDEKTRMEIKNKILTELSNKVTMNGVIIDDVLMNKIILPRDLRTAIENKLQAEQEMQKMTFTLEKERKEAERKEIEASGIKKFQNIVSEGISEPLLRWKGIAATEEIAKSNNSKLIIIGNMNGLPLVFNPDTQSTRE